MIADALSELARLATDAAAFGEPEAVTYVTASGTLSLRERGAAPGFNLIEVEPRCVRVKALAYERSRFDVWRTWSFDRRD